MSVLPSSLCSDLLQVTNAIASRKATFLAEDDWLTLPFGNYPKNVNHQLFDMMVHISGILEETDSIAVEIQPNKQLPRTLDLISRCWNLHDRFRNWYVN